MSNATSTSRRTILRALPGGLVATAASLGLPRAASAQGTWPDRPVRVIVPYGAGQGADVLMRLVAAELMKSLKQSFVIENRAGAGGNIGTAAAAQAAADGYTLTLGTSATHAANEFLYTNLGYDPGRDFDPVAMTGLLPMVVSTSLPDLPANGMAELIRRAREKPNALNVGLPSTTAGVVLAQLQKMAGAELFGVRYKSSSQAMTDVIGGQIPLIIDTATATRPQVASGKLRALGITSLEASEVLPGVRSVAEQGVPGFDVVSWNAIFAPRGTPREAIVRLAEHVERALADAGVRQKIIEIGVQPKFMGPDDLDRFVKAERPKWGGVIRSAGIKVD